MPLIGHSAVQTFTGNIMSDILHRKIRELQQIVKDTAPADCVETTIAFNGDRYRLSYDMGSLQEPDNEDFPSWGDAPDWANWMAMDDDGEWYWYEKRPAKEKNSQHGVLLKKPLHGLSVQHRPNNNEEDCYPSWDDAPEWANWMAMDKDGEWYWFAPRPIKKATEWDSVDGVQAQFSGVTHPNPSSYDWTKSIQPRPGKNMFWKDAPEGALCQVLGNDGEWYWY